MVAKESLDHLKTKYIPFIYEEFILFLINSKTNYFELVSWIVFQITSLRIKYKTSLVEW